MRVDARPFFVLAVQGGGTGRCLRPDFNARSVGVGGSAGALGTIGVAATHTVTAFSPLPAGLTTDAVVTIDDTTPPGRYRVVTVAPTPAGADVYLAADPAPTTAPYVPDTTPDTPRTAQRLPYVAPDE